MNTVAILQPSLWPWLGAMEQVYRSDIFVFYCDVQMTKNDWRNRNRIRTPQGWQWLTVPILHKGKFGQRICDVEINNAVPWGEHHLKALRLNYARAPFFPLYYPELVAFYARAWGWLEEVAEASIKLLCSFLGLKRELVCSRTLDIEGERSERLVRICQHLGADTYYSGAAAMGYLNISLFKQAGIRVVFQAYQHPVYPQRWGGDFIPHLSILDLLFNVGPRAPEVVCESSSRAATGS